MTAHGRVLALLFALTGTAQASDREPLPSPLRLEDALAYASAHRAEIAAARARARAAERRPDIVSALEDPMVMASLDHLPFMLEGADASVMVEQRFPISGILGERRRAAEADARRWRADSARVAQDVLLDAARAFLMLWERRETARVLAEQLALGRVLVSAASARYGAGTGAQPDVLRAESELARLGAATRAIGAEVVAAEAMLNASLGRRIDEPVPALVNAPAASDTPAWREVREAALRQRPELNVGRAEIGRAQAEVSVMESMYWPMGMVRTGPAYTMSDGWGWMATLGISIPLWRDRLDAGVGEARAMTEMARADLRAMTRMIEGEAAIARQRVLAVRERVSALRDDVLPRARQVIDSTLTAYAAGTVPLVSAIDAAQSLWSTQAELVAAETDLGLAWAHLYRAQGRFEGVAR